MSEETSDPFIQSLREIQAREETERFCAFCRAAQGIGPEDFQRLGSPSDYLSRQSYVRIGFCRKYGKRVDPNHGHNCPGFYPKREPKP